MKRLIVTSGCCIVLLALMAGNTLATSFNLASDEAKSTEAKPDSPQEEPKAKEAKTEPDKEEVKPSPTVEKPSPAAEKPKPAAPSAKPPATPPAAPAAPKPATHTVKGELFKTEVSLQGTLEAKSKTEVSIRPKAWTTLKVLEAVAHGSTVERGDVLVQLELKDIDRAISDHRTTLELAELSLKQAQASLKLLEATTPMDLAAAERNKKEADEDLQQYLKVDLEMSKKSAEYSLKYSQQTLEYETEELRQLQKMYEADDLTEETEEIILKRQRNSVERAEFYYEQAKLRYEDTMKFYLPRSEQILKDSTERVALGLTKTKVTIPAMLSQAQHDLEKIKITLSRDQEKLDKLLADREAMTVKAPTGGIVYYGRFKDGTWGGSTTHADKLRPNGSVTSGDIFMTIVKPRPLLLSVQVPEKNLNQFKRGLRGTIQPAAYPSLRLSTTVTDITAVPVSAGNFQALLSVKVPGEAEALMPGMACVAKFVTYLDRNALTVPASAVSTDKLDDQKHYVYLVTEAGKQKKRRVNIGNKTAEKVEILIGLEEGDQVLKEYPKD